MGLVRTRALGKRQGVARQKRPHPAPVAEAGLPESTRYQGTLKGSNPLLTPGHTAEQRTHELWPGNNLLTLFLLNEIPACTHGAEGCQAYALFHWPTPTCPRTKVSGGYSAQGPGDTSHPWLVVGLGCPGPSEAKRFLGKQSCLHHLPAQ